VFVKNKYTHKKNLPSLSIMDETRVSPRPQFQCVSTDFTKKKKGDPLGGGYESDVTGGNFNSTYDDGFGTHAVSAQDEAEAFSSQWRPAGDSNFVDNRKYNKRKQKLKRSYNTKAHSVNSGGGFTGHKCFI
jgi:hypothetical protein